MRLTLASFVVAMLLSFATNAAAQPAPWQPERLTAGWTFTPALGFGGLWDSNSTLRVTGDPQIAQWVGLINPRGELDFNGRRTRLTAGYSGALQAYRELEELTRYEQLGRFQFRHSLTPRLNFGVNAGLTMAPSTERIELGSLPFENVGSTLFTTRANVDYAVTRRIGVSVSYDRQLVEFHEPKNSLEPTPTVLRGGYQHGATATGKVAVLSRFWTGASYSYHRAHTDEGAQTVDVLDGMLLVGARLAEHTTVEAGAGYASLRMTSPLVVGALARTGPSYRAALAHSYERVKFDFSYDRTYVPSWSFGGTSANQQVRSSVFVPFMSGRMSASGHIGFSHNEPLISAQESLALDTWSTGWSVGYGIARWMRVEAFYNANFQESSARGKVTRERVGVQFVTLKPVRIQ